MRPHSTEWYKRLSTLQEGFYYPWQSHLSPGNGEDAYLALVQEHLNPTVNLLDVACGHGALTLQFARHCHTAFGYDLIPSYIEIAQAAAHEQAVTNAHFLCYDSSIPANNGQAHIPAEDNSFDLLVCSKGPFHWVEDARRVARNGATLIMLIPDGNRIPEWHDLLPTALQWSFGTDPNWARNAMEPRLAKSGIPLHSWWSFDVPEYFTEPEQLYIILTWGHAAGEKPPYEEVAPQLATIFADYSTPDGLALRHRRYLWKAIVTK
jgi:23S rRNA (guanine745-N1)-methyltransferase